MTLNLRQDIYTHIYTFFWFEILKHFGKTEQQIPLTNCRTGIELRLKGCSHGDKKLLQSNHYGLWLGYQGNKKEKDIT